MPKAIIADIETPQRAVSHLAGAPTCRPDSANGAPVTAAHPRFWRQRPRHVDVVVRFAPFVLRGNAGAPAIDAAWSPDGEHLAYIPPGGNWMVKSLRNGSQRIVADHVEALDW